MTELSIVPECFVDTKIAEIVSGAKRKYNHQHGIGNVANLLKNKLINIPAIGIIDEDKNKGPKAGYFLEFDTISEKHGLILKRHQSRSQFLILICPAIENWLLDNALSVSVNPISEEFGLPNNLFGLKERTKREDIDRDIGFYRFIKELLKKEATGIITLKLWLENFKEIGSPV